MITLLPGAASRIVRSAKLPQERPGDLGPKQVAWCEANIPNFRHCKASADAAAERARQVRDKIEGRA